MPIEEKEIKKNKTVLGKIARILVAIILSLIAFVIVLLILIQTPPVQNFARKKAVNFLQKKLGTRVEINNVDIDFPKLIVLDGIYLEDKKKDTLLSNGKIKVDIDMLRLLKNELSINEIYLEGTTAKIKRALPDTAFNYQFIIDAFVGEQTKPSSPTEPPTLKMHIDKIIIDNIRIVYKDVVTGVDADIILSHIDTRISAFDPFTFYFDVPSIAINGLRGNIIQKKPLQLSTSKSQSTPADASAPMAINFKNQKIWLTDIDVNYKNEPDAMKGKLKFNELRIYPEKFDLDNYNIAINKIKLNKLDGFLQMDTPPEKVKAVTTPSKVAEEYLPWKFTVKSIEIKDNNFSFDDNTQKPLKRGMDYAHLDFKNLNLNAENFLFHKDTIAIKINSSTVKEKSGLDLRKLEADAVYTSTGAAITGLKIETPFSKLGDKLVVNYPSLEAIQKKPELLKIDVNLNNNKIAVKDILLFAPQLASQPAFSNPNATFLLDTKLKGSMKDLNINEFTFSGFGNTTASIKGNIQNAADPKKINADLVITNFKTTKRDILSIVPKGTVPSNITLPENISLTGKIKGGTENMFADIFAKTSLGNVKVNGKISNLSNTAKATYDARINADALDLGTIMQQKDMIGKLTADLTIKGTGLEPEKANARVVGTIQSAVINNYNYQNATINGEIANQKIKADFNISDPNIDLDLRAIADISGKQPGFTIQAKIDSIKTQPLNFTTDPVIYRGNISANFPSFNLDALNGKLLVTNSLLVANGQRVQLDSLNMIADYKNGIQNIKLKSDFINATINGKYKLAQLGDAIIRTIQPYYAIQPEPLKPLTDSFQFTINAYITDHPSLYALVPELKKIETITIDGTFSSSKGLQANVVAPQIVYGTNKIDSLSIVAKTEGDKLNIETSLGGISAGGNIALFGTKIKTSISGNKINFELNFKDKANVDKYNIQGLVSKLADSSLTLSLLPGNLLLNYEKWNISPDNRIIIGNDFVNATNFNLRRNSQLLSINSLNNTKGSPLELSFSAFKVSTLTGLFLADSDLVNGSINGNILLRDVFTRPNFVTDLTVNNLTVNRDTLGNLNAKVNNITADVFDANVSLTGMGNDVKVTGKYFMKPGNKSTLDFLLDIQQLQLNTIEGATFGAITDANGYLAGKIKIDGRAFQPNINGALNFNDASFIVTMLNTRLGIANESKIKVDNDGLNFRKFTITDQNNNPAILDGVAYTQNFINYLFDLRFTADNFMALNSVKKPGAIYYGKLFFTADMHIGGTEFSPEVDGSLRINENTDLTVVLPQTDPGVVSREGVIKFVDKDAPPSDDTLFMAAYDTLGTSSLSGYDISLNVEIDKKATFNVIVDEANGDFLNVKGEAFLNAGIDKSGKITMVGTYVLEEGAYELSFNFIKRKFNIQKGSTIVWKGTPTDADINLTAIYIANTAPLDLVQDQLSEASTVIRNTYLQKLPFEVHLMMKGELLKPEISFDIKLSEAEELRVSESVVTVVQNKLTQLQADPSELNKQVFALLVLNRFVSENPFESSGGGFNAGAIARQSVSRVLTDQLNQLAGDLIAGVDLNFDVASTEDYTTGERSDRTDLNVSLSKRFLSDRLKVSIGSNYQLEGARQANQQASNLAGNIAIDYQLSKDGRYLLRAYRKNEYEGVVEGYIIETGVGFVISMDYNKFKELFMKKKKK